MEKVTIQLRAPRGNDPGKVAIEYWVEKDNEVILTDEKGVFVDRYKYARKLKPGESAKAVACVLARRRNSRSGGDFNRKIIYPRGF